MKKTTYWTAILSIAGKTCLLFAAAYVFLPSSAKAQCATWDLSGDWNAVIANGPSEHMNLEHTRAGVAGYVHVPNRPNLYPHDGVLRGTVQGDKVQFNITWSSKELVQESYDGTIGQDGKIVGQANIFAIAGSVRVDWASDRPMKCLANAINRLKIKPAIPPDPALTVPGIMASPNNVIVRAPNTEGKTSLIWDGGKDHPHAEIWVKVDDQDETKVVESGQGTLKVAVVPGKIYVYMLKDKGQVLASVTVKFRR